MKQSELALWLKIIVVAVWVCALVFCLIIIPFVGADIAHNNPEYAFMFAPSVLLVWLGSIPLFVSLVLAWKIFDAIGRDNSFCEENSIRLKYIGRLALFDAAFFVLVGLTLLLMNMLHPSIIILITICVIIALSASVVMAALSHLTYKAFMIKKENDLTI